MHTALLLHMHVLSPLCMHEKCCVLCLLLVLVWIHRCTLLCTLPTFCPLLFHLHTHVTMFAFARLSLATSARICTLWRDCCCTHTVYLHRTCAYPLFPSFLVLLPMHSFPLHKFVSLLSCYLVRLRSILSFTCLISALCSPFFLLCALCSVLSALCSVLSALCLAQLLGTSYRKPQALQLKRYWWFDWPLKTLSIHQ